MKIAGTQNRLNWMWASWLLAAMLSLAVMDLAVYGLVFPASALLLAVLARPGVRRRGRPQTRVDKLDLAVIAALYLAVVALFRLAFTVFTAANVLGLFLCFGAGLVLGVAGPVFYTVRRRRPLSDLGLLGRIPGIALAAALYSVYHVGYGMSGEGMAFLFGLGVVYAVAFALVRNVLVLWPVLTPLGSFFNNLNSGDIDLPWEAILGFADVLGLMVAAVWLGHRRLQKAARRQA